jgi:hypothetical protein
MSGRWGPLRGGEFERPWDDRWRLGAPGAAHMILVCHRGAGRPRGSVLDAPLLRVPCPIGQSRLATVSAPWTFATSGPASVNQALRLSTA